MQVLEQGDRLSPIRGGITAVPDCGEPVLGCTAESCPIKLVYEFGKGAVPEKSPFFSVGLILLYFGSWKYLFKNVSRSRCFQVCELLRGRHVATCTSIVFTPCNFPNA